MRLSGRIPAVRRPTSAVVGGNSTYPEAERRCAELGALLATPRTEQENQCAPTAAGTALSWLGFTDVVTECQFLGADGCGTVSPNGSFWAPGRRSVPGLPLHYVLLAPEGTSYNKGWTLHQIHDELRPLCQLQLCYQATCL